MNATGNIVVDRPHPRVRVVRFLRPDVRSVLYDADPISDSSLYREICAGAEFSSLTAADTVVLNFGLVEWLPSMFFCLLMELRADVHRRGAKLFLCGLQPAVKEVFDVMGGSRLFDIRASEHRAVADGAA